MTWANRFRLLGGLVISLAVIFVLVVVFNQRQHTIASTSATRSTSRVAVRMPDGDFFWNACST